MAENTTQTDLSVRNESIQRIFNFYKNNLLNVNRRYQRKLIWTIEEKQRFIDSLIKNLPVPYDSIWMETNRPRAPIQDTTQRIFHE